MDTQELLQQYDGDMYLRISHEDGDKAESDSIANQRDLITAFWKNTLKSPFAKYGLMMGIPESISTGLILSV